MIQEYDPGRAKPNLPVEKIIKHGERVNEVTSHLQEVYVFIFLNQACYYHKNLAA